MPSVETLAVFSIAALIVIVSPGPSNLYVMARSVTQGVRGGVVASTGLAAGAFVHVIGAAAGLSIIFQYSPVAYTVLKIVGAVYLVWLGITQIMSSHDPTPETRNFRSPAHKSDRRILVESALVEVLNPKVALFFLAFLPQFVDASAGSVAIQFLVLGTIFMAAAFACDLVYAVAAGRAATVLKESRTARRIQDWASGSALIGLGGYMAFSARD